MPSTLHTNINTAVTTFGQLRALESEVQAAAALVRDALLAGRKLLACGNGGSAADAAHLTTEFVCRFTTDRRPYPALCLNAHGGDLTAIGNDYDFQDVFARQVRAFGHTGDVLLTFTTSGCSANVIRALHAASAVGVKSVALLGRGGGDCRGLADVELIVPGTLSARIQEAHKLLLHTICEIVENDLPRD